jgi:hypothetical protein
MLVDLGDEKAAGIEDRVESCIGAGEEGSFNEFCN